MDLACGLADLQHNFLQAFPDPVDGVNQLADFILAGNRQAGAQIACGILPGKRDHLAQWAG
ncbi:Uncharacterised protein [Klebsiella pneumoniae]|nr:Uncharacterised protein [Klebsiella pneumoniae]